MGHPAELAKPLSYDREWADWHPFPTTVPSGVLGAIDVSLRKILAEGLEERIARTAAAAHRVRQSLAEMGFEMFVDDAWASPVTTSVKAHPDLPAVPFDPLDEAPTAHWRH